MNCYKDQGEAAPVDLLKVSSEMERAAVERVRAYRAKRSEAATKAALQALRDGVKSGANLMALILAAVKAGATLGETSDAMRAEFGLYRDYSGF